MFHINLVDLFGANAYQTDNFLVINKADFPNLTPTSENNAESLLIAILLNAIKRFEGIIEDDQGRALTNATGKILTYSNIELSEVQHFLAIV